MAENENGTEYKGSDEREARFIERWEGLTDEGRLSMILELRRVQQGVDRKNVELSKSVEELTARVDALGTEKTQTVEQLQAEAAAVAAQRALNEQTANMLQRGVEEKIDPRLAIEFAQLPDPGGTFDRALREIDRRASEKVNEILAQSDIPESSPSKPVQLDLSQFSAEEIGRMPDDVVERAMVEAISK